MRLILFCNHYCLFAFDHLYGLRLDVEVCWDVHAVAFFEKNSDEVDSFREGKAAFVHAEEVDWRLALSLVVQHIYIYVLPEDRRNKYKLLSAMENAYVLLIKQLLWRASFEVPPLSV